MRLIPREAVLAAAILIAAPAAAATVTQTVPLSYDSVGSGVLTFDGFDAALGDLVEVRASFQTTNTLTGTISMSTDQVGPPGNFEAGVEVRPFISIVIFGIPVRDRREFSRDCQRTAQDVCLFEMNETFDFSSDGTDVTDLAEYVGGPGAITATFSVGTSFISFNGTLQEDATLRAGSGSVTLEFDYVPTAAIPLPAAAPLLLAGNAALAAASRRRRPRGMRAPKDRGPG